MLPRDGASTAPQTSTASVDYDSDHLPYDDPPSGPPVSLADTDDALAGLFDDADDTALPEDAEAEEPGDETPADDDNDEDTEVAEEDDSDADYVTLSRTEHQDLLSKLEQLSQTQQAAQEQQGNGEATVEQQERMRQYLTQLTQPPELTQEELDQVLDDPKALAGYVQRAQMATAANMLNHMEQTWPMRMLNMIAQWTPNARALDAIMDKHPFLEQHPEIANAAMAEAMRKNPGAPKATIIKALDAEIASAVRSRDRVAKSGARQRVTRQPTGGAGVPGARGRTQPPGARRQPTDPTADAFREMAEYGRKTQDPY